MVDRSANYAYNACPAPFIALELSRDAVSQIIAGGMATTSEATDGKDDRTSSPCHELHITPTRFTRMAAIGACQPAAVTEWATQEPGFAQED